MVSPDHEAVPERASDDASSTDPPRVRVVGVGASAGGLDAFRQFLSALPVDTGMSFVLVSHLAPEHESALSAILQRTTRMPVVEAVDGAAAEADHVYVIPPGQFLRIGDGVLELSPRVNESASRVLDHFLESLADDLRAAAIGVVLSGTARDGTLGLESIKAAGGTTFAQDDTAQHSGMPKNAIESGCVDYVLPPDAIAREIARIALHRDERNAIDASSVTAREPTSVAAPISRTGPASLVPRRILVVDDNRDGADSLARVLALSGHETRVAADGAAALVEAERFRPDVILLDIGLPVLNGFEVARRVRQEPWGQAMVLVAVTGWGQEEHRRESSDAGFDAHLVKPVDPIKLVKFLASLIDSV